MIFNVTPSEQTSFSYILADAAGNYEVSVPGTWYLECTTGTQGTTYSSASSATVRLHIIHSVLAGGNAFTFSASVNGTATELTYIGTGDTANHHIFELQCSAESYEATKTLTLDFVGTPTEETSSEAINEMYFTGTIELTYIQSRIMPAMSMSDASGVVADYYLVDKAATAKIAELQAQVAALTNQINTFTVSAGTYPHNAVTYLRIANSSAVIQYWSGPKIHSSLNQYSSGTKAASAIGSTTADVWKGMTYSPIWFVEHCYQATRGSSGIPTVFVVPSITSILNYYNIPITDTTCVKNNWPDNFTCTLELNTLRGHQSNYSYTKYYFASDVYGSWSTTNGYTADGVMLFTSGSNCPYDTVTALSKLVSVSTHHCKLLFYKDYVSASAFNIRAVVLEN